MKDFIPRNRQFLLYCVIGASGVLLDFCTYSLLLNTAAFNYQAANAAGYAAGTLLSFFLNAHFNFQTRDRLPLRLLLFSTVALLGWTASAVLLYLMVARFGVNKYWAKLGTLVVVLLLQFNLNRLISFRKTQLQPVSRPPPGPPASI
jgi:putative flippase GtrA